MGHLPSCPHPGGFDRSRVPVPGNLPSRAGGGGGGLGTGGVGHFTVMDGSEAKGDLVLIQTFFALLWKLFLKNTS